MRMKFKVFSLFGIFFITLMSMCSCAISPNLSKNVSCDYTNYNYRNVIANYSSKLAFVDDKMYYNYYGDPNKNGTYEISDNTIKRVYGENISDEDSYCLNLDNVYDDKVLSSVLEKGSDNFDYIVNYYDITNNNEKQCLKINNPNHIVLDKLAFVYDSTLYFYSNLNSDICPTIYRYCNNNLELVISPSIVNGINYGTPILDKNYMYFYDSIYKNNELVDFVLYKYDMEKKKIIASVTNSCNSYSKYLLESSNPCMFVINDKVYGCYTNSNSSVVCVTDMNLGLSKNLLTVKNGSIRINGYDKRIIVGVEFGEDNGIYIIDTETYKNNRILKNESITQLYVFNDKFIYYTNAENPYSLFRINHDGKSKEKIFD